MFVNCISHRAVARKTSWDSVHSIQVSRKVAVCENKLVEDHPVLYAYAGVFFDSLHKSFFIFLTWRTDGSCQSAASCPHYVLFSAVCRQKGSIPIVYTARFWQVLTYLLLPPHFHRQRTSVRWRAFVVKASNIWYHSCDELFVSLTTSHAVDHAFFLTIFESTSFLFSCMSLWAHVQPKNTTCTEKETKKKSKEKKFFFFFWKEHVNLSTLMPRISQGFSKEYVESKVIVSRRTSSGDEKHEKERKRLKRRVRHIFFFWTEFRERKKSWSRNSTVYIHIFIYRCTYMCIIGEKKK